jgi:hypothetical protein
LLYQIELAGTLDERFGAFLAADGMPSQARGAGANAATATSRSERLAALLAAELSS